MKPRVRTSGNITTLWRHLWRRVTSHRWRLTGSRRGSNGSSWIRDWRKMIGRKHFKSIMINKNSLRGKDERD